MTQRLPRMAIDENRAMANPRIECHKGFTGKKIARELAKLHDFYWKTYLVETFMGKYLRKFKFS